MKKVLGISGSPNKAGNTAYSLRYALEKAEAQGFEVKYLSLSGREMRYCDGCWSCQKDGVCIHDDGMSEIYEALRRCDALILASPVYFGMVSGPMKMMMDRCVALRPSYDRPLELAGKIGCGIACGGFRNGGQETTLQNIHTFLLQQNMKAISDGLGFCHAGATIVGSAAEDELGLRTIENMVANMKRMM